MSDSPQLLCHWSIPGANGAAPYQLEAAVGAATVVVGRNGSGKSALGYWMQIHAQRADGGIQIQRVIAHRRNWFDAPAPGITAGGREQTGQHMLNWSRLANSRWLDHAQGQRTDIVLFDLMSRINYRNALVAAAIDDGMNAEEARADVEISPLTRINAILDRANLPVAIDITKTGSFDAVSRTGGRYPITRMSDGEKSALLLAAELLLAPESSVLIVDEPERHLHRAISAGLIEAIMTERPDCHFVVLTHDLELASTLANDSTQTIVLSDAIWTGGGSPDAPGGWLLHALGTDNSVPDDVRAAVLGVEPGDLPNALDGRAVA